MRGDWAATTHYSDTTFTGNLQSSFAVISPFQAYATILNIISMIGSMYLI